MWQPVFWTAGLGRAVFSAAVLGLVAANGSAAEQAPTSPKAAQRAAPKSAPSKPAAPKPASATSADSAANGKSLSPQDAAAKEIDPGVDREGVKEPDGFRRLQPDGKVWLDAKNKRVVMLGEVVLREGQLEMFACLKGTKEHESLVAVPTKAFVVHAALTALGAAPGRPAEFAPVYKPAVGPRVDVTLFWTDAKGVRRRAAAQDWIRNVKTKKPMTEYWVFAGSNFYTDDRTGQQFYRAEDGDFICISNFSSAMMDLPIESSQSNQALLFDALTDQIPPQGTKVSLVLTPRLEDKKEAGAEKPAR